MGTPTAVHLSGPNESDEGHLACMPEKLIVQALLATEDPLYRVCDATGGVS